jgi:hypothetical protein
VSIGVFLFAPGKLGEAFDVRIQVINVLIHPSRVHIIKRLLRNLIESHFMIPFLTISRTGVDNNASVLGCCEAEDISRGALAFSRLGRALSQL